MPGRKHFTYIFEEHCVGGHAPLYGSGNSPNPLAHITGVTWATSRKQDFFLSLSCQASPGHKIGLPMQPEVHAV